MTALLPMTRLERCIAEAAFIARMAAGDGVLEAARFAGYVAIGLRTNDRIYILDEEAEALLAEFRAENSRPDVDAEYRARVHALCAVIDVPCEGDADTVKAGVYSWKSFVRKARADLLPEHPAEKPGDVS